MVNHILRIKPTFFHIVFSSKTSLTYVLIRGGSSLLRILLDFPFHLPLSLVEETDDGPELAFTEDYLYFCIKYNVCLSCGIFYHLDLFIQLPPFSPEMAKYHYTNFWQHFIFHFRMPCPWQGSRLWWGWWQDWRILVHSSLLFGHPPPHEREREWVRGPYSSSVIWLDWIMPLFHVYLFCDRYHFSLKLLLLTVYSYAKFF